MDASKALRSGDQELETQAKPGFLFNGAKRIRTADPLHAMQVLYQLSYGPINDGLALEQIFVVGTLHREVPKPAARQRRAFPEPALDLQAAQLGNRPGSRPPAQQWGPGDGNA